MQACSLRTNKDASCIRILYKVGDNPSYVISIIHTLPDADKRHMPNLKHQISNTKGFTLIEIAIVMVIMGILMGAGVSIMKLLTERKMRNATVDYMKEAETVLFAFADINGRLPWADTDSDGDENTNETQGYLPYKTLGISPRDPFQRPLKYELNSGLGTDRSTTCSTLTTSLATGPSVIDSDGSTNSFVAAAAIMSSGPMDADGDNDVFDAVTSGSHQGDNTDGNPNYIRHPPTDTFDDFLLYVGRYELYSQMDCTTPSAGTCGSGYTLRNNRGSNIRRSPSCALFNDGGDMTISVGESFDFWTNTGPPCSGSPDLTVSYSQLDTADADDDCKVEIDASFALTEDSGW